MLTIPNREMGLSQRFEDLFRHNAYLKRVHRKLPCYAQNDIATHPHCGNNTSKYIHPGRAQPQEPKHPRKLRSVSDIPDELLVSIFQLLKDTTPRALLSCVLTCKRFHQIGQPLLSQLCFINKLPEELILRIFEYLQQDLDWSQFTECMTTSRSWYRIGKPLYLQLLETSPVAATAVYSERRYENHLLQLHAAGSISLGYYAEERLGLNAPKSERHFKRSLILENSARSIQDLTLSLEVNAQHRKEMRPPAWPIHSVLANMHGLRTLSIARYRYNFPSGTYPKYSFRFLPRTIFADIVENLPPTVVNLELDIDYDRKPYGPRLCDSLARIFPRLVHVRLALTCLCRDILVAVGEENCAPALKTATIAFYDWWVDVDDRDWRCCNQKDLKGARHNLIHTMENLIYRGAFPQALVVNLIQYNLYHHTPVSQHQNMHGDQRGPGFLDIRRFSREAPDMIMGRDDFVLYRDCHYLKSKCNDGVYDSANVGGRDRGTLNSEEIIGIAEGAAVWKGDHICGRLPPSSFR